MEKDKEKLFKVSSRGPQAQPQRKSWAEQPGAFLADGKAAFGALIALRGGHEWRSLNPWPLDKLPQATM
jgi:hypothetical protein